ncbi:hypothetical protein PG993_012444 [Apiospora rasikravindrae]|uniref:Uncharacterized protein n=1 Tax=Apiospora rasikravindrae TaxID=990691 RepID=A0ABR1S2K8_9PEZI
MGILVNLILGVIAVLLASLYQSNVHFVLYTGVRLYFGVGHTLEPLTAFPAYRCRRIEDERLQACEDMWLSEATRQLFLACSDPKGRQQWSPKLSVTNHVALKEANTKDGAVLSGAIFNASGRSLTDHIAVLNIDEPEGVDGAGFRTRVLGTPGYPGTHGDGTLNLVGMSGHDGDSADGGEVRLWLIDAKPSVDLATGRVFEDQTAAGGNQTVEVFRAIGGRQATALEHLESFWDPLIMTPNRIAAVGDETNAFWVTNDLGHSQSRWKRNLSPFFSQGSVAHCSSKSKNDNSQTSCHAAIPSGLSWPNGLVHNRHDGLLYVPSSMLGKVDIYAPTTAQNGSPLLPMKKVDTVDVGYAIDNLMVDKHGDVWAAVFPVAKKLGAAGGTRLRRCWRMGWGEVLPMATSVVHDATTGRVISPFIAVCDKV